MGGSSGFQLQQDAAERYQRETAVFMRPMVDGMLAGAGVGPGMRVLDLACGPGIAALAASDLVGPTGHVTGVDVNPGMLAVARRSGPTAAPVEWVEASAMDLPFDDDRFDVVVAQQGVQFFPDLDLAVAEMTRVTRPGGTVAATSWTPMDTSPYLHAQYVALREAVGEEGTATLAAAFDLTGERLEQAWARSGMAAVARTVLAPPVTLPPLADYVPRHFRATPWGAAFDALDPGAQDRLVARMVDLLADHTVDGVVTVPFSTWLVTGSPT